MPSLTQHALILLCLAAPAAASAGNAKCPPVEVFAPDVISTDLWEWRLSFTPDRRTAYWSTSVGWWPGTRERAEIRTSTRRARDTWSAPVVTAFSGIHADMDPFVSPDGRHLFFSSMRPVDGVEKVDMDLWVMRRYGKRWGDPVHLAEASVDGEDELYPSIDRQGNLYFARVGAPVPTGDVGIWRSQRRPDGSFAPAEKIGPTVNTAERWEFNPEISPDGRTLLFVRLDRPDDGLPDAGYGFGDIYVSRLVGGDFGPALNLGPCVNTAADEFHPTVLWDRRQLYFARDPGAPSDFHRTLLRLPR